MPAESAIAGETQRGGGCGRADRRIAVGLILLSFAVYNLNFRVIQDGDTVPTRLLPFAIWRSGSLSLDAVAELAVLTALLAQLYAYSRSDFRAGACYGPRYLTDSYPLLVWLLLPVIARLRGNWLRAFVFTVAAGVAIEAVGAFCYPRGHSDALFYPATQRRGVIAPSVWSPANVPFLIEARAGLAPPELLPHRERAGAATLRAAAPALSRASTHPATQ